MLDKLQSKFTVLNDFQLVDASEKEELFISDVITMLEYLMTHKIDPNTSINSFESNVQDFIITLESINNKQQQIDTLKTAYQKVNDNFVRILRENEASFFVKFAESSMRYENELNTLLEANKKAAQIAETGKLEIEQLVTLAKGKIAEIGVREYEQVFGKESKEFEVSAWLWLTALVASISALIAIGLWFLPQVPDGANGGKIAEVIFRKIVVITGLFYLVALFARNYRASKHNALVNKHRQNALKTFQIFVKSVQDDDAQTKNAVLLKATETIFGSQPSGFLPDTGDGDMSPKIIEIFKNFPTTSGK